MPHLNQLTNLESNSEFREIRILWENLNFLKCEFCKKFDRIFFGFYLKMQICGKNQILFENANFVSNLFENSNFRKNVNLI